MTGREGEGRGGDVLGRRGRRRRGDVERCSFIVLLLSCAQGYPKRGVGGG